MSGEFAVDELMPRAHDDLATLVSFKSVANSQAFPPEECQKAADWIVHALEEVGFEEVELLDMPDGTKTVFGQASGPAGAPTVLLYSHFDVQPPLGEAAWETPPFTLTERADGRWYGRGATDCKGNVIAHLTTLRALRAARGELPCTIKFLCEGSEESNDSALEEFVPANPDLLRADAVCWADLGNFMAGEPTLTTSLRGLATIDVRLDALAQGVHSGSYGGPAPDPVAALMSLLASLHDERGDTRIDGLAAGGAWSGTDYPSERFRGDANVLDGVQLLGSGAVADMLWARPAATIIGIDVPTIADSVPTVQASAAARVSLRFPPRITARQAADALADHLQARVPWNLRCSIEVSSAPCEPYIASLEGRAHDTMARALETGFGAPVTTGGEGGSNPLISVFAETFPETELMLYGIEEPRSWIHAPNESVDPRQIERVALSQALFLADYAR